MKKIDLSDRTNCFYWQTDRNLSPEDFKEIFLKRHQTSDTDIVEVLKNGITSLSAESLELVPADENVIKGNVNIVRKIRLKGKEYVVRMHPKSVKNGYFFVEKIALMLAEKHNLPVPQILEVHEASDENDMDFILMSVSQGMTMDTYLSKDNSHELELLFNAGATMAKLHDIHVNGFGPFDNQVAKKEKRLLGLHKTNKEFILIALEENLQRLVNLSVSTHEQTNEMRDIMNAYVFEPLTSPVMVHNDFADWNLLTDGKIVTGILDWDECCGGDPIADLACWSMFFNFERYAPFLKGYTSIKTLPEDYEQRFRYYRLRYAISKMALRAKRFLVDQSDEMKHKIEIGKEALKEEIEWFKGKNNRA